MSRWVVLAVPLALAAAGVGLAAFAPPQDAARERAITLDVVAVACGERPDGVCLAYGGVVPGPTLDIRLGERVALTLVNRIPETLAALDAPEALKERLAAANVSFHAHGLALPAEMDGLAAHDGAEFVPSVAAPGGAFTYRFRAAFAGAWHYHDHVLGHDGSEGTLRGLFGALVVRGGAEPQPDATFDLHLHDAGPNAGRGLEARLAQGESFELVVVGLGSTVWRFELDAPGGAPVAAFDVGPGMSERVRVPSAAAGAYAWRASWGPDVHEGEVVVG